MAEAQAGDKRGGLEFAVSPRSHLWVAACLATAGACLGAAALLGLGELLYATKQLLLEALFQAG
jgi:hypothetical protein